MAESVNYIVKKITLNQADIETGWVSIVIFEDIYSNEMSGYIDLFETETFREGFAGMENGIIGEEKLHIEFCSRFPNKTEQKTIKFDFVLNKLHEFEQNTLEQKVYRLHFVSQYHDENVSHRNRKVWTGTADNIVSRIVTKQLGAPLATVDPAKFVQEIIFPNLMPYQVANFLADISISKQYNDPKYLFFEDRHGFNFTTMSKMIDQPPIVIMTAELFADGKRDQNRMNIQSYTSKTLFDSTMNEFTGMFGNSYIMYDKIDKKYHETTKTYTDSHAQFKHVGETKLTRTQNESPKNRFQFMIAGKPENPNTYIHTDEWTRQLLNRSNQIKNNSFIVTYTGNTDLEIGKPIEYAIMSTKDLGQNQDKKLSGKFLITRIKHIIERTQYRTMLEIGKDGYKT